MPGSFKYLLETCSRFLFAGLCFLILPGLSGCFINGSSDTGLPATDNTLGARHSPVEAQLKISIKHSHELAAALRGSNLARAVFELKLINYGNTTQPFTLLRKTADVVDNQATVSFNAVPVVSTIVSLELEGAHINNKRSFHAGIDLKPGENSVELVASGSAEPEDLIAQAALLAINDFATMQVLPAAVFSSLHESLQTVGGQTSAAQLFSSFSSRIRNGKPAALAAGESHSLVLREDGTFAAFGSNIEGQLGQAGANTFLERKFAPFHQTIIAIAAGADFSLLLAKNNKVYACGTNENGQLAAAEVPRSAYPLEIAGLTSITAINAGYGNGLALDLSGNLFGWGRNSKGQLGITPDTAFSATPRLLATGVKQAAAGNDFILLVKIDGTVWGMGDNSLAQMAADIGDYSTVPVQIHGLANISQVAAGQSHCLALDASGRVFAWGGNFSGQTGLGADLAYETPAQISSLSNIARIAAGKDFSLFCNAAGVLWGCGSSANKQLGANNQSSIPVQMSAPSGVSLLACGGSHSLAQTAVTLAWGGNEAGQCGNGQASEDGLATPAERALSW